MVFTITTIPWTSGYQWPSVSIRVIRVSIITFPSQQRLLQGTLRQVIRNVLGQRTNQQRDVAGKKGFKSFKVPCPSAPIRVFRESITFKFPRFAWNLPYASISSEARNLNHLYHIPCHSEHSEETDI